MTPPNSQRDDQNDERVLDTLLGSYTVSPPSDLLASRILREAKRTKQDASTAPLTNEGLNASAHSAHSKRAIKYWPRIAALVLVAFSVGIMTFNSLSPVSSGDEAIWLEAANDLGMDEIYDWVENESPSSEDAF